MNRLTGKLSKYWNKIQGVVFPWLEEELDSLTEKQRQLIVILEMVGIEQFLSDSRWCEGRPSKTFSAVARSFVTKTVYNIDTTKLLIERLKIDKNLRCICGWTSITQLPSESTFSLAFADFTEAGLLQRTHEALIENSQADEMALHTEKKQEKNHR